MPILGLFDSFDNLDAISVENIAAWLKNPPQFIQVENYLANKILYPQTLSVTQSDMEIDLAILREALKLNGPQAGNETNSLLGDNPFINITLRKILIPVKFLDFIPDLTKLVWVFIDAFLLNRKKVDWFGDLWTIVLTDDTDEVVGSVVLPQFESNKGEMLLSVLNKSFKILQGSLTSIPCPKNRCQIAYQLKNGHCLGKNEAALEVYGGRLGLIIDGRGL